MEAFTFYNPDGSITCNVTCPEAELVLNPQYGTSYISGAWDSRRYYVANGAAVLKTEMAPVINGNIVTNLPDPCDVSVEGKLYKVTGGQLEFASDQPGPYTLTISAVPNLDKEIVIQ